MASPSCTGTTTEPQPSLSTTIGSKGPRSPPESLTLTSKCAAPNISQHLSDHDTRWFSTGSTSLSMGSIATNASPNTTSRSTQFVLKWKCSNEARTRTMVLVHRRGGRTSDAIKPPGTVRGCACPAFPLTLQLDTISTSYSFTARSWEQSHFQATVWPSCPTGGSGCITTTAFRAGMATSVHSVNSGSLGVSNTARTRKEHSDPRTRGTVQQPLPCTVSCSRALGPDAITICTSNRVTANTNSRHMHAQETGCPCAVGFSSLSNLTTAGGNSTSMAAHSVVSGDCRLVAANSARTRTATLALGLSSSTTKPRRSA
mmetsp:Transcript_11651/g.26618  ORF Transcript_11651/g.26618 Transcript_11651/m.26618 type:complete len:315 (-) Transcript_11651:639-1583(-)